MKIEKLSISRKVGLIDKFKELKFKVGVEIGTHRGGYARDICTRYPELTLYTLDPWLPFTEGDEVLDEDTMEAYFEEAKKTLSPFPNCTILRETSMGALKYFADDSLDFVFVDGNHEYEEVYKDITEWAKKVRKGGIMVGHDYVKDDFRKYGIIEAVNRYVEENNIEPLYILEKGTYVPCWLFYKK